MNTGTFIHVNKSNCKLVTDFICNVFGVPTAVDNFKILVILRKYDTPYKIVNKGILIQL